MSYQLYCIFRQPLPASLEIPDGVGGHRVFTANYKGLGVVLSKLPEADWDPDAAELVAYEEVVESFYHRLTVIPMRCGCRVECPYDAIILLRENYDAYVAVLQGLQGLAEMGLQVLLDDSIAGAEVDRFAIPLEWHSPPSSEFRTGSLDANELPRQCVPQTTLVDRRFVENLCGLLGGSFVRHKVEFPSSQKIRLLSMHFLVPRDSVETFRQTACHLPASPSIKLFLSGPFPPYNFVDASS